MNNRWLLIIFAVSGTAALVYEITWIRPLSLIFGTTIYAVSTIVASFILGLALGSWVGGKYTDRMKNPLKIFAYLQIGVGVYGIALLPIFGILPDVYLFFYDLTYPNLPIFMFLQVTMAMSVILIPATMMGTTLPLLFRSYSKEFDTIGRDVGKLDASNSIGAVIGTLAAGFIMIPFLGIQNTIIIVAIVNIGLGIIILVSKKLVSKKFLLLIIISVGLLFAAIPGYDVELVGKGVYAYHGENFSSEYFKKIQEKRDVKFYKESMYSTIVVYSLPDTEVKLSINGKIQCSTEPRVKIGLHNLALFPYEMFEHNHGKPKNALNIGLGCGITSKWIADKVNTTTIEIDSVVTETTKYFVAPFEHNLIIDDGRNWMLRNNEKFDIIITEPFDPFVNNGAMYTLEYFELMDKTLSEKGVVAQWVPNFEFREEDFFIMYNTFHHVFPYVYIFQMQPMSDSQWVFVGSHHPLEIPEDEELFLYDQDDINYRETVLNVDDRPVLEFSVARNIYD